MHSSILLCKHRSRRLTILVKAKILQNNVIMGDELITSFCNNADINDHEFSICNYIVVSIIDHV